MRTDPVVPRLVSTAVRYAILFPGDLQPVHLAKEVGQLPLHLHREHRWACEIWAACPPSTDWLPERFPVPILASGQGMEAVWNSAIRARRLDLLQTLHLTPLSLLAARAAKVANPRCVTWAKLDYNRRSLARLKRRLTNPGWAALYREALRSLDVVSAETSAMTGEVCEALGRLRTRRQPRIVTLPNGGMPPVVPRPMVRPASALFVGRVGAYEKATDILLSGFAEVAVVAPEATLALAGPVEPGVFGRIEQWRRSVPLDVSKRLTLLDNVADRGALSHLYAEADLFVMPSRWESSGIAMIEAACQGCYLIVSDVGAARDILRETGFGVALAPGDRSALTKAWLDALRARRTVEQRARASSAAFRAFSWKAAADRIAAAVEEMRYDLAERRRGAAGQQTRGA